MIDGFDRQPVRAHAFTFREDNGIRLDDAMQDDGMQDRLRARAWPWACVLALAALVALAITRRRIPDRARFVAPALLLVAALAVLSQLA